MRCWGELTDFDSAAVPREVKTDASRIVAGPHSLCAFDQAGAVACTGAIATGGIGELIGAWKPIFDGRKLVDIAGKVSAVAVTPDSAIAWNTTDDPANAERTAGIRDSIRVWGSCSGDFGCALSKSGELHCWGRSFVAQLGDGVVERDARKAVKALLPEPVIDAALGSTGACARVNRCLRAHPLEPHLLLGQQRRVGGGWNGREIALRRIGRGRTGPN